MRVSIAEDSTLLREGLVQLLVAEGHVVLASVGNAEELLASVASEPPDVVVLDVRMPPDYVDEGIRAALTIRERWEGVGVLVLSQYVERRNAAQLITGDSSGVGYLLKDRVIQVGDFLSALERVAAGETALDPEVVRQWLTHSSQVSPLASLSDRERGVLDLMAQGYTNAAIGEQLHVSQSAIEKHVNAIFVKLKLDDTGGYSRRVLAILTFPRS